MINGDVNEFVSGLYYGNERFFLYNNEKYFIQGYYKNDKYFLELYIIESSKDFQWKTFAEDRYIPVDSFLSAKIFNGKSFWEVEQDIEWVDC